MTSETDTLPLVGSSISSHWKLLKKSEPTLDCDIEYGPAKTDGAVKLRATTARIVRCKRPML